MISKRKAPRPKALWVQIRDAKSPPAPKRTKRVRQVSKARSVALKEYEAVKAKFLAVRQRCERCNRLGACGPLEVHHLRGRVGPLLCDVRHWAALCRECHTWIHEHPASATLAGWLGPWGKSE